MFQKLDQSNHEHGSQDRYGARPRHHFWWFIHNCISHPLIGVVPVKPFFDFHDWTSEKINKPNKPNRRERRAKRKAGSDGT